MLHSSAGLFICMCNVNLYRQNDPMIMNVITLKFLCYLIGKIDDSWYRVLFDVFFINKHEFTQRCGGFGHKNMLIQKCMINQNVNYFLQVFNSLQTHDFLSVQIKRASCPDRPAVKIYSLKDKLPAHRGKKSGMLYVKMFLIYFKKDFFLKSCFKLFCFYPQK